MEKTEHFLFDENQKMLAFAFLADIGAAKKFKDQKVAESEIIENINAALTDPLINQRMGGSENAQWTIYGTPCILLDNSQSSDKDVNIVRNLSVIFLSPDESEVVIGVAGTNFVDIYDWFTEDLETSDPIPWNEQIINSSSTDNITTNGYVSQGSAVALNKSWTAQNSAGSTVVDTLLELLHNDTFPNISKVSVSGHSLGGAISPVLAAALTSYAGLPDGLKVGSYIFAGPTPGDARFVDYIQGDSSSGLIPIHSTWIANDVVPHAWQRNLMEEILHLFDDAIVIKRKPYDKDSGYNAILFWVSRWLLSNTYNASAKGHEYTRWKNETIIPDELATIGHNETVTAVEVDIRGLADLHSEVKVAIEELCGVKMEDTDHYLSFFGQYLLQLAYQHITAYFNLIFKDEEFSNKLKGYCGFSTDNFINKFKEGNQVLAKLFIDTNNFKKGQG